MGGCRGGKPWYARTALASGTHYHLAICTRHKSTALQLASLRGSTPFLPSHPSAIPFCSAELEDRRYSGTIISNWMFHGYGKTINHVVPQFLHLKITMFINVIHPLSLPEQLLLDVFLQMARNMPSNKTGPMLHMFM